ncbi:hypothetical protein [Methanoplanus endosymbiosus]|uniref:Uncharacterized protein n=1 Tax=Methanoplanus endosymbiosus TaxID=33865 RepID=A0A9E7PN99_9EURY|nr:hypothetical protein [Methanoplanus endosymbiosus]UUX92079.1 hypothetical protein L6E24_12050 [Methanoplanus endosymbiosus]
MRFNIFAVLLLLLTLACPAAMAIQEETLEDIQTFSFEAPEGLLLSGLRVSNLPAGGNFSGNFNAYGDNYLLTVGSYQEWGWWNFDIDCQYPNGTTQSIHLSKLAPFSLDYDLNVQPWVTQTDWMLDVDVSVSVLPLQAVFPAEVGANPFMTIEGSSAMASIAFANITGTTTDPADVTIFISTPEEFKEQQENNWLAKIGATVDLFFQWTWDNILNFAADIPYIGKYLETGLTLAEIIISEVFFWFSLIFIEYPELTFLTMEFFILGDALISTRTLSSLVRKVVQNHIAFVEFMYSMIVRAIELFSRLITVITEIIQSLKPI